MSVNVSTTSSTCQGDTPKRSGFFEGGNCIHYHLQICCAKIMGPNPPHLSKKALWSFFGKSPCPCVTALTAPLITLGSTSREAKYLIPDGFFVVPDGENTCPTFGKDRPVKILSRSSPMTVRIDELTTVRIDAPGYCGQL